MSSIKFSQGLSTNLDNLPLIDGQVIFLTDTNEWYVDYLNSDEQVVRKPAKDRELAQVLQDHINDKNDPHGIKSYIDRTKLDCIKFAICTTNSDVAEKIASCEEFKYENYAEITIEFTYGNTVENPTLNVNGLGSVPIRYMNQAIPSSLLYPYSRYTFRYYEETNSFELIGEVNHEIYSSTEPVNQLENDYWMLKY